MHLTAVDDKNGVLEWADKVEEAMVHRIFQVIGSTNESLSLWVFDESASLKSAMEPLEKGIHRMLVSVPADKSQDKEYKVLTQLDIVRFISTRLAPLVSKISRMTLGEVNVLTRLTHPVESVSYQTPLITALLMLSQRSLSALPILDQRNRLLGTFSLSDIRGMDVDLIKRIPQLSVLTYFELTKREVHMVANCTLMTAFGDVLDLFSKHRYHRLWIVDKEGRVAGVVSLTDVIRIVYDSLE
jgi:CBS-domain-containing membrane protein